MSDTPSAPMLGIDSHAHVFSDTLELVAARRYTPDYQATPEAYLQQLQAHGLSHGVLVQPSFLGTDNRYLLQVLQAYPQQLRGVVVVEPDISRQALQQMADAGVVGARLNLMGKPLPDFADGRWIAFLGHLRELGWHLELHRQVADLPGLIRPLIERGVTVVVDHFGRADARLGLEQPGFAQLLALGASGQVWVKVSGIYRLGGTPEQNLAFARAALPALLAHFGPQRLVWGSDWPHTQHEHSVTFGNVDEQLQALGLSAAQLQALRVDAPRQLFRFD